MIRVVKSGEYVGKTVGFIKGFKIVPQAKKGDTYSVKLIGAGEYDIAISDSDVGTIMRLENGLDDFDLQMRRSQSEKASIEEDLAAAKEQVDKPFEQAEEAEQLRNELAAIDAELDLGKEETPIVLDEDTEAKPIVEILNEDDDEDVAEVA